MNLAQPIAPRGAKKTIRILYMTLLVACVSLSLAVLFLIYTKEIAFSLTTSTPSLTFVHTEKNAPIPFPVSVNPALKTIIDDPLVNIYLEQTLTSNIKIPAKKNWLKYTIAKLAQLDWYQNLASPSSRILIIRAGERKEEVVDSFGDILHWDVAERATFEKQITNALPTIAEGTFFPGHYLVGVGASPEAVAAILNERFNAEILLRYTPTVAAQVPIPDALTIASILEREAYDFTDMREISGVIWNRLFIDMNLQIDATLQYAKGTNSVTTWWPPVIPADKYIDSPYNTYRHKGLPPAPISNPSANAILAALNPVNTKCLFYFHDSNSQFHCSPTYEEHVAGLKNYYGQGR